MTGHNAVSTTITEVAAVDFGPFLDGSDRQAVADAILESFKSSGFAYLKNHGLAQNKIDEMFRWSKLFFAQPLETKMLAPHPTSGMHHRGYSAPGVEKVLASQYEEVKEGSTITMQDKSPDVKESYECGREDDEFMPNIWLPEATLPGFKEACLDFFWTCFEVECTILKALAIAFHLPEEYFLAFHTKPDNQLRLLHYPSVPLSALESSQISRINGHSDFGSLTILMQDDVGGLEVENPNEAGNFLPVPPIEGTIIINAGDFLMRWSNDTIRSTVHRVRWPSNCLNLVDGTVPERYSIPYFCGADFETVVDCIPGTWSDNNPKKYQPISAGNYILERLNANY